jgi:hypothetical protein
MYGIRQNTRYRSSVLYTPPFMRGFIPGLKRQIRHNLLYLRYGVLDTIPRSDRLTANLVVRYLFRAGGKGAGQEVLCRDEGPSKRQKKTAGLEESGGAAVPPEAGCSGGLGRDDGGSLPLEAGCQQGRWREGEPGGKGAVGGVDPEVWASLPPEIQRELRLDSMAAMGRGVRGGQQGAGNWSGGTAESQRAAPKRGGGAIAKFFAKK